MTASLTSDIAHTSLYRHSLQTRQFNNAALLLGIYIFYFISRFD